jgi:RNA polymerase sigma factor (sigma-70 family)
MAPLDPALGDLVRRLRQRDPEAISELALRYEDDIRRIARVRLARFGLRHIVDSEDIAQSVFGRFLMRLQSGELEFETPEKILHFLAVIAANRINTHARRERLRAKPLNGTQAGDAPDAADPRPGADRVMSTREELAWWMNALNAEDRELLQSRLEGKAWAELAAEHGTGADALRKRLSRALDELVARLGQS